MSGPIRAGASNGRYRWSISCSTGEEGWGAEFLIAAAIDLHSRLMLVRVAPPEDLGATLMFLLSDEASHVAGAASVGLAASDPEGQTHASRIREVTDAGDRDPISRID